MQSHSVLRPLHAIVDFVNATEFRVVLCSQKPSIASTNVHQSQNDARATLMLRRNMVSIMTGDRNRRNRFENNRFAETHSDDRVSCSRLGVQLVYAWGSRNRSSARNRHGLCWRASPPPCRGWLESKRRNGASLLSSVCSARERQKRSSFDNPSISVKCMRAVVRPKRRDGAWLRCGIAACWKASTCGAAPELARTKRSRKTEAEDSRCTRTDRCCFVIIVLL
mmetsp:Transcript_8373/g.22656  ORF Transcript_8373/g.22656 Transcript_8373/m.22656 type:complete len:223 (+) Transcript_8373:132-800(+)